MPVFADPEVAPNDESIAAALGPVAARWPELLAVFATAGADVAWRYYRDGGWLARAQRKRKTVAWLSVEPGRARVTIYFAERHRELLCSNPELAALQQRIATTPTIGRLLPVTVDAQLPADVALIEAVVAAKLTAA